MNNSGQPAFPEQDRNMGGDTWTVSGLTKREYAAIKAMQGILSREGYVDQTPVSPSFAKAVADDAIAFADALLAELEKTQTP